MRCAGSALGAGPGRNDQAAVRQSTGCGAGLQPAQAGAAGLRAAQLRGGQPAAGARCGAGAGQAAQLATRPGVPAAAAPDGQRQAARRAAVRARRLDARHGAEPRLAGDRRRSAAGGLEPRTARGGAAPAHPPGRGAGDEERARPARACASRRGHAGQRAAVGVHGAGEQRGVRHRGHQAAVPRPLRLREQLRRAEPAAGAGRRPVGSTPPPPTLPQQRGHAVPAAAEAPSAARPAPPTSSAGSSAGSPAWRPAS